MMIVEEQVDVRGRQTDRRTVKPNQASVDDDDDEISAAPPEGEREKERILPQPLQLLLRCHLLIKRADRLSFSLSFFLW
ncbi:unnamed protein product [Caenorhabditis auriculariae]|uniref:Uncharacterized protein n=1 Tax=Caenorhabditis auriculariae TaxID=2777116 RepID=A0A8S1GR48_9PELO|nr:unnamed protein product [Caenorhabditis auriculariae]